MIVVDVCRVSRSSLFSASLACSLPCLPLLRARHMIDAARQKEVIARMVSLLLNKLSRRVNVASLNKVEASYGVLLDDDMSVLGKGCSIQVDWGSNVDIC
jgi:hypothetical protein